MIPSIESPAGATFQLVINDFSKFIESGETRLSPQPYMIRNLPWKILATSKKMSNKDKEFVLGFFLQCNTESNLPTWSVRATAELKILHSTDPEKNLFKKIQHLFCLPQNDWGFSPFATMKEIMDPEKRLYNQLNDCITLEVSLNASQPTGIAKPQNGGVSTVKK